MPKAKIKGKAKTGAKSKTGSARRKAGASRAKTTPSHARNSSLSKAATLPSRGSPSKKQNHKRVSMQKHAVGKDASRALGRSASGRREQGPSDPWGTLQSPYGGKMSPADEWKLMTASEQANWYHATREEMERCKADAGEFAVIDLTVCGLTDAIDLIMLPNIFEDTVAEPNATSDNAPKKECATPADRLAMRNADLPHFVFTESMRKHLIGLDLSGNMLRAQSADIGGMSLSWLRDLNLSGNQFNSCPSFKKPMMLLRLNLSYNKHLGFLSVDFGEHMKNLRDLNLEGCLLTTLAGQGAQGDGKSDHRQNVLLQLPFLENLNVAFNSLGLRELTKLLQLRTIRRLSLHHNPGCEEPLFDVEVLGMLPKKLPSLKYVNGIETKLVGGKAVIPAGGGSPSHADGVVMDDNSSCSCREGNPCISPYNCRDWTNRFEVARRNRQ